MTWLLLLLVLALAAWVYLLCAHGGYWRTHIGLPAALPADARAVPATDKRDTCSVASGGYPPVCVIVPARNEAEILPRSLPGLLRQDYPGRLRVVLVDDQSEDGTAEVARDVAQSCGRAERLSVVRVDSLPAGWAGKVWAMQQGFLSTSAEDAFLVFTDADIWHPPTSIRALVDKAEAEDLQLVSRMVRLRTDSFWEKLLIPAFVLFFAKLYPFRWVNRDKSRVAAAAGGCILVRRACLPDGLLPIRSALIDDCALARWVKGRGGRIWLGLGPDVLSLRSYSRLGDIWRMVARSAFVQLRYSGWLLAGVVLGMTFLYLLPPMCAMVEFIRLIAGVAATPDAWALALGAATWLLISVSFWPMLRWYGVNGAWAPLLPLAALLYTGMTMDSARRFWLGGKDMWKGRPFVRQA
ncbi:glycosyltransferase [Alicyclobacillus shizuokensis]|uniref:glycosyltransferase n=1 Tax=Alicyclobacillus shizuokensis TaxID=392014 RepID=UPI00082A3A72|nr:glycosyltransferase [Alicyclobacillus shizuokensis]